MLASLIEEIGDVRRSGAAAYDPSVGGRPRDAYFELDLAVRLDYAPGCLIAAQAGARSLNDGPPPTVEGRRGRRRIPPSSIRWWRCCARPARWPRSPVLRRSGCGARGGEMLPTRRRGSRCHARSAPGSTSGHESQGRSAGRYAHMATVAACQSEKSLVAGHSDEYAGLRTPRIRDSERLGAGHLQQLRGDDADVPETVRHAVGPEAIAPDGRGPLRRCVVPVGRGTCRQREPVIARVQEGKGLRQTFLVGVDDTVPRSVTTVLSGARGSRALMRRQRRPLCWCAWLRTWRSRRHQQMNSGTPSCARFRA